MSNVFDIAALDARITKGLLEQAKLKQDAADRANAALEAAQTDYVEYFKRVCDEKGVDATLYRMDFVTHKLEPIGPPPPPKAPVKAPDADLPPAPFVKGKP